MQRENEKKDGKQKYGCSNYEEENLSSKCRYTILVRVCVFIGKTKTIMKL